MRIVGISEKLRFLIIRKSFAPGRIRCDKLGKCYFAQLNFVVGSVAIVVVGRFASRDGRHDGDIIDVPSHQRIEGGFAAARRRSLGSKFGAVTHDRTANPRADVNFTLSDMGSSFSWVELHSGGCMAVEHSLQRRQRHQQAAANADRRDFLAFGRLIGGPARNPEHHSGFVDGDDAPLRVGVFKGGVHFTLLPNGPGRATPLWGIISRLITTLWGIKQPHIAIDQTQEHVPDMRTKPADDMVQSAIRLPRTLHERLKKAGGDRGMGEEVRRRLEASFAAERSPTDVKTRELLDAIAYYAEEIARELRPWSKDPFAFRVLKEAISLLLADFEPEGEAVPPPNPDSALIFLFDDEPLVKPEKVSRYFVGRWKSERARHPDKEKRK